MSGCVQWAEREELAADALKDVLVGWACVLTGHGGGLGDRFRVCAVGGAGGAGG